MKKITIVSVVLVAVVAVASIGQLVILYKRASDNKRELELLNATVCEEAIVSVEHVIASVSAHIATFDEKAQGYATQADQYESTLPQAQKARDELKEAFDKLFAEARSAGFPKPSEAATLTEAQKQTPFMFGDKSITGSEVYYLLKLLLNDYQKQEKIVNIQTEAIELLRSVAQQIEAKKVEVAARLVKLREDVDTIVASNDNADYKVMLAEFKASLKSVSESGRSLAVIEKDIVKLNTLAAEYQEVAPTKTQELDWLDKKMRSDNLDELNAYWERSEAND